MHKIQMTKPLVEIDGDEMARIVWRMIKEELILPFVDLRTDYYDLSLENRELTRDKVTKDAANAIHSYSVGVKCSTITPNLRHMEEYRLSELWRSPNGTIRSTLDGTVFRTPIITDRIKPAVRNWKRPITIARHAHGDLYSGTEYRIPDRGKAELVFTGEVKDAVQKTIYDFKGPGVVQGIYNTDESIFSFARSCFRYAAETKQDLWFSAKDTVSKTYDTRFRDIFQTVYEEEYQSIFECFGLTYSYRLIDDAISHAVRSEGGFVWALKNYDGDILSDLVSGVYGSPAMMSSVLCSPSGAFEYEAAHGTVTRHFRNYLKTGEIILNPVSMICAWSGALTKRGELDQNGPLAAFGIKLEKAYMETIHDGVATKDLIPFMEGPEVTPVDTASFIRAVRFKIET